MEYWRRQAKENCSSLFRVGLRGMHWAGLTQVICIPMTTDHPAILTERRDPDPDWSGQGAVVGVEKRMVQVLLIFQLQLLYLSFRYKM